MNIFEENYEIKEYIKNCEEIDNIRLLTLLSCSFLYEYSSIKESSDKIICNKQNNEILIDDRKWSAIFLSKNDMNINGRVREIDFINVYKLLIKETNLVGIVINFFTDNIKIPREQIIDIFNCKSTIKEIIDRGISPSDIYKFFSSKLKEDEEFMMYMIEKDGKIIEKLTKEKRDNKEVAMVALKKSYYAYEFLSPRLKIDSEVVELATNYKNFPYYLLPKQYREDVNIISKIFFNMDYPWLSYDISEKVLSDINFARNVISEFPHLFYRFSDLIKGNKELIVELITITPNDKLFNIIKFISNNLLNDKEIANLAIEKNANTYKYFSAFIRDDEEIAVLVAKKDITQLKDASQRIKSLRKEFKNFINQSEISDINRYLELRNVKVESSKKKESKLDFPSLYIEHRVLPQYQIPGCPNGKGVGKIERREKNGYVVHFLSGEIRTFRKSELLSETARVITFLDEEQYEKAKLEIVDKGESARYNVNVGDVLFDKFYNKYYVVCALFPLYGRVLGVDGKIGAWNYYAIAHAKVKDYTKTTLTEKISINDKYLIDSMDEININNIEDSLVDIGFPLSGEIISVDKSYLDLLNYLISVGKVTKK